jgi:hypothetical protein
MSRPICAHCGKPHSRRDAESIGTRVGPLADRRRFLLSVVGLSACARLDADASRVLERAATVQAKFGPAVERARRSRRPDGIPARVQARPGRHRVEAQGLALSFRTFVGLDQVEEPGPARGQLETKGVSGAACELRCIMLASQGDFGNGSNAAGLPGPAKCAYWASWAVSLSGCWAGIPAVAEPSTR